MAGSNTITPAISLAANLVISGGGSLNLVGNVSGSGFSLTDSNTGSVTLGGSNSYTGGTLVGAGTLASGNVNAFGTGTLTDNATVDLNSNSISVAGLSGNGVVTNTAIATTNTLALNTAGIANFSGSINSGSGGISLTMNGTGTQILSGGNSYTGTTTISSGTLQIGNGSDVGSIASSPSIIDNGVLAYNVGSGNRTNSAVISGTGSVAQNGTGTLTLAGVNTYSGTTAINAGGTIAIGSLGSFASTNIYLGMLATRGTLDFVAKSSGYVLNSNQTLSGSGTVNLAPSQALTINGNLNPGNSHSIITVNGGLTLGATSTSIFQILGYTAGVGYNQVNVSGDLTYGGSLVLQNTNTFVPIVGDIFQLFTATGNQNAGLTNVALAGSWTGSFVQSGNTWSFLDSTNNLVWNFSEANGQLAITAIPEPEDLVLLGGAICGSLLFYRRRKSHLNN